MQTFRLIDFIIFLGISQGIFLAIAIQMIQNKNRLANRVLSWILGIATIMLTGRFFFTVETKTVAFFRLALFVDVFVFIFGPLLYLYYRRLIFKEQVKYRLHYINFIPAVGMFTYHLWTYQYSYQEFVLMARSGDFVIPFFIVEITGILFNFYFWYRCFQLFQSYSREEKKNLSYAQDVTSYLRTFLWVVVIFLALWVIGFVQYYFFDIYLSFINYNMIWILIPVFIYIIGFYSLKQPDIFRMPLSIKPKHKSHEGLDLKQIQDLNSKLEEIMVKQKVYLNHRLTLVDLAKTLDISTNKMSWLLNNIHKTNFYDYINKYRVEAFIEKIQNGEHHHHTLLALSIDSGFNSKSTFNRAFKMFVNDTPREYVKKLGAV
ncbi:helix-turn-helix domain-containing protein [Aquimarina mytili]|uniref:Helix-turn-helix domain-containing protein n=1 Tax=Aquimarina mytili TaxID=874423 RepID=A0A937D9R4_9FLAO|nr:AraC family transcriptional regulator [Aquimarina mytili]MBL0683967.1 helix-turn-helix domain-containing protein [Aquimarina mytili]